MDHQIFGNVALRTFLLIFLAEMGDKTQLMSMALAAKHKQPVWVFLGAATALAVVTLIGVICGDCITRVVPARRIHQFAGALFMVIGALMLFKKG